MAKIDPTFPYDAYRFIIQGVRNADKKKVLERFMGGPQTEFERTHAQIQTLPTLLDPAQIRADLLQFLRHSVGWDNASEVAFVRDLNETQLRKLIKVAAVLWKAKGIPVSIRDAIRVFTGKNAILKDWFYHRLIIDEAGAHVSGIQTDPFAVGGIFSEDDDELTWVLINRGDLDEDDKQLLHSLLTFIRASGEHFGIVYAAFADDFSLGLGRWETVQSGDPNAVTVDLTETDPIIKLFSRNKAAFDKDANIATRVDDTELATWQPYQRFSVIAIFSAFQGDGANNIEMRIMVSENREEYYSVKMISTEVVTNDEVELRLNIGLAGGSVQTRQVNIINIPVVVNPPLPFLIEIECAPQDQASNLLTIGVVGETFLQLLFIGDEAYNDPLGGVQLVTDSAIATGIRNMDDTIVIASPMQIQLIGQQALPVGGVADPDPGIEPFVETPAVGVLSPHVTQSWGTDPNVALDNFVGWPFFGGLWHLSTFSRLGPNSAIWWTDGTEVGEFPNQTVDPDYDGAAGNDRLVAPSFNMSAFSDLTKWDCQVRIWYRPTKFVPLDGGATPQTREGIELQYEDLASPGWVTLATLSDAVELAGSDPAYVVHWFPPDGGDSRVSDGSWWQEQVVTANALLGLNGASLALQIIINGTYVTTGFGIGLVYMAVEVLRK